MKSQGFKKLTYQEAVTKRQKARQKPHKAQGKVSKPKKVSVSKLHKLVWVECRRVQLKNLPTDCYTCPSKNLKGSNCQLGHGQSKGSLPLGYKYDLRNLKWQCMPCNVHNFGRQELFLARLENEEAGREFLLESSYKNENGGWAIQKREPIVAWDFLTELLERLKMI